MPVTRTKPFQSKSKSKPKRKKKKVELLSRTHRPPNMSLEDWQIGLRRQFGREQKFKLTNVGDDPVFSEFRVVNPTSGGVYRVRIRGLKVGESACSCPDFMTNSLGTCKHLEFVLAKVRRLKGVKDAITKGFRPPFSEIFLQYGAARQVRFLPGVNCPGALLKLVGQHFNADGVLPQDAIGAFDGLLEKLGDFDHDVRVSEDALGFIAEIKDRTERDRLIQAAFPEGTASPVFAQLLRATMYEYQKQGALFAARAGRCLIADEMGLGKTIQAIAAAEIMARHLGVTRVLIICPTSLKHQWEREISRFIGRSAGVINGLRTRRQELFQADTFFKITNYDTVHSDLDLIAGWGPDLVILDEAQRIKNWNTRAARSVKKIESPYAIVLTGTPLENRLEELVSIVQFVDQHRLGPTFRFLADHQLLNEDAKVVGYRDLDTIGKTLAPVMIRRQKSEVLKQLPPRLDKNFFVRMTPEQMAHHDENQEIVAKIVQRWRKTRFLSEADKRRLMIALQNMRMSCNSTFLLDGVSDFGLKADELMTVLEELFERPGTKVVIFSQWLRTHELLVRRLKKKKIGHVLFHGGLKSQTRKEFVDRFREDDQCRLFLSTDAGGVGLNLQHASAVINMDLPWNPAVLEQRIGRIHRLGQLNPVQVINFVSQGTIEEGMLSVLKFKKSMFVGALDGGEKDVLLGGSRLSRFMETVEQTTAAVSAAAANGDSAESERPKPTPAPTAEEKPVIAAGTEAGASTGSQAGAPETGPSGDGPAPIHASTSPVAPSVDPTNELLGALLKQGLSWLSGLNNAANAPATPPSAPGAAVTTPPASSLVQSLVRKDPQSGETYLRLPVGEAQTQVIGRVLSAAAEFIRGLKV